MFGQEGVDMRALGIFYTMVVHTILLYRLETWVMYPRIGKILGGFHHRVVRRLKGQIHYQNLDGKLTHPPLGEAMEEIFLQEMEN